MSDLRMMNTMRTIAMMRTRHEDSLMWWFKLIGVYLFGTGLAQLAASLQRLRGGASTPSPFQPPTVPVGTPIPVLYGTAPVPPFSRGWATSRPIRFTATTTPNCST
jgi:hypothetical protein